VNFIRFILFLFTLTLGSFATAEEGLSSDIGQHPKSAMRAFVDGGKLIRAGEFDKSNKLLARAVKRFPDNDMLLSKYGESLFESGSIDESESYFMNALKLNKDNIVALQHLIRIREIQDLRMSKTWQEVISIFFNKVGDIVVLILGFSLGSLVAPPLKRFFMRFNRLMRFLSSFKLINGDSLDDGYAVGDILREKYKSEKLDDKIGLIRKLESFVPERKQASIDSTLKFMLKVDGKEDQVQKVLEEFVIREEDKYVLKRSLKLLPEVRSTKVY